MKKTIFVCPICESHKIKELHNTYGIVVVKCESCGHSANSVYFIQVVDEDKLKKCWVCKRKLPKSEFYRDASRSDGIDKRCKECSKVRFRERDKKRNWKEYNQKRKERGRTEFYIESRKYPLAKECELCSGDDKRTESLERHHFDYNHPEIFVTVCHECHANIHFPIETTRLK